jgi:hypothetical protein
MQYSVALAFVVVAVAPLIGIWRGHVWAKANRMILQTMSPSTEQDSQAA